MYNDYKDDYLIDDLGANDYREDGEFEEIDVESFCPFCRQFNFPFGAPFGPGPGMPFAPGGGPSGPPTTPPPGFAPTQQFGGPSIQAVDPGAIRPCTFRFIYIRLDNGRSFWAWLVFVGPRSAAGWRWNGRRWVYFGIDLRRIESFQCY